MISPSALAPYAHHTLPEAVIPELPGCYRGKVRENYDLADGTRILIATDRISAFDRNLAVIPLKGQVLTQTARFWFEATQSLCPNHVIEYPDPNVLVCKRLSMMPVEIVVRDYLAGTTSTSILQMYRRASARCTATASRTACATTRSFRTPSSRPPPRRSRARTMRRSAREDILARKLLTEAQWQEVADKALALFACGRETAARQGLILVDTKYEFGFDEKGAIVLADEVHTPDSSRYWLAASYPERFARARRRRRWTRISCGGGWRRAAIPTPIQFPTFRRRSSCRLRPPISTSMKSSPDGSLPCPTSRSPPLARVRANLRKYFERAA